MIFHYEEDASNHEGHLWMRRLPWHDMLLPHKKSPKSKSNFKLRRCHFWQLLLNFELNIFDTVYHHRTLLVEIG